MAEVDHLGWVVSSIDESRAHFETALGLAFRGAEEFPGLRVAFFGTGPASIELLEPHDEGSDIGSFLARRGEGIHHVALRVDDVASALAGASRHGFRLMDATPRPGARGTRIGYVDPGRADGVLIQYVSMNP